MGNPTGMCKYQKRLTVPGKKSHTRLELMRLIVSDMCDELDVKGRKHMNDFCKDSLDEIFDSIYMVGLGAGNY